MRDPRKAMSRRAFCGTAAAVLTATASSSRWGHAAEGGNRREFVDVHVHFGQPWCEREVLSTEMLLRWMDAHDVAQAWVLPLVSPESYMYVISPEYVFRETAPYRDRLIPFCSIDPRNSFLGHREKLDQLKRFVDAGARGFGEHKWGGKIDDPKNIDLLAAVSEMKLPVLFHTDNVRNTDLPGLPGLDKVLTTLPELVMIGHGPGWWASISGQVTERELGGYPRGPIAPGGAIDRLMDKHANLYADLSAGSGSRALRRDLAFSREFLLRRVDRILFGTDYLMPNQEIDQFAVLDELDLPDEAMSKISHGNARRILGAA